MADHSSATATKLATSQRSLDPKLTRRKHVYIQDPSEEEDRVRTAIEVADEKGLNYSRVVERNFDFNTAI